MGKGSYFVQKAATERELISVVDYNGQSTAIKSMPSGLCMMSLVSQPACSSSCDDKDLGLNVYSLGGEENDYTSTQGCTSNKP